MNLLIVDDDPVARNLLKRILGGQEGVDITEAEDGLEAWEMLEKGLETDLCLLDVMMPRMDGLELLQKIRGDQRFKDLKVIMCSVVRDGTRVRHAINLDIEGYIVKPFRRQMVKDIYERAILRVTPGAIHRTPIDLKLDAEKGLDDYLDSVCGFIARSESFATQTRQWLEEGNRTSAWEAVSVLRDEARQLKLDGFDSALIQIEAALMSGDNSAARAALETTEAAIQALASLAINVLARSRAGQRQEQALAV